MSAVGGAVGRGEVVKPMAVDASTPSADWPRATGVPGVATTTAATMAMMAATAVAAVAGVESAAARRVFTLATLVDCHTSARACDRSVAGSVAGSCGRERDRQCGRQQGRDRGPRSVELHRDS